MSTRPSQPLICFVIADEELVRTKVARRSRNPYAHRCPLDAYRAIATKVAEGHPITLDGLVAGLDLPFTQADVALAFMKDRGVVVPCESNRRWNVAASDFALEDAMTEWHALVAKGDELSDGSAASP